MSLGRVCRVGLIVVPVALLFARAASAQGPVPALPQGIHLGVDGRYFEDVCDHSKPFFCLTERVLPADFDPSTYVRGAHPAFVPFAGGPPTGTGLPSNFAAAYHITSAIQATGGLVTLIDLPDSHALADANTYRTQFGIPAFTACTFPLTGSSPCFITTDENGGSINQNVGDDTSGGDTETALDIDMVSAACPACSILLVQMTRAEADSTCMGGPPCVNGDDFLTSIASANTVAGSALGAISISFGGCESGSIGPDASSQDPAGPFTSGGHLVLAASGDQGYLLNNGLNCNTPSNPASNDTVLAVGGTNMSTSDTETAWNSAGSGCSTEFAMPAYQTAYLASHAGAFAGCTKRDTADVSAVADFNNKGVAVYDSSSGGWGGVLGTSAASPMFAAILTMTGLVPQVAADFGYLYTHPAFFNDITTGKQRHVREQPVHGRHGVGRADGARDSQCDRDEGGRKQLGKQQRKQLGEQLRKQQWGRLGEQQRQQFGW